MTPMDLGAETPPLDGWGLRPVTRAKHWNDDPTVFIWSKIVGRYHRQNTTMTSSKQPSHQFLIRITSDNKHQIRINTATSTC